MVMLELDQLLGKILHYYFRLIFQEKNISDCEKKHLKHFDAHLSKTNYESQQIILTGITKFKFINCTWYTRKASTHEVHLTPAFFKVFVNIS